MQNWQYLFLTGAVALCLYRLLPLLACRCSRQLRAVASKELRHGQMPGRKSSRSFMDKIWQKCRKRLARAGYCGPHALQIYLALQIGVPFVLFVSGYLSGTSTARPPALALMAATLVNGLLQQRIDRRQQAFAAGLFRIYRFLNMQISSGIAVTDALKGLHEAMRDPVIHPVLVRFTALYEMTLDFTLAFSVVEQHFPGKDSSLLAAQITQSLQSGIAGKGMERLETLYFTRAFAYMQAESSKVRVRLVYVVAGALVPVMLLFLYPLLHGALQAVHAIFS